MPGPEAGWYRGGNPFVPERMKGFFVGRSGGAVNARQLPDTLIQALQTLDWPAAIRLVFEEYVPFNRVLQVRVKSLDADGVVLEFPMRPELVGNFLRGSLHGGVISATLDVAGGLAAFVKTLERAEPLDGVEAVRRFARLGTIDLRVDYLSPGVGQMFTVTARTLRAGSRVAVTRMQLHNEADQLLAVGTGAYIVS